MVDLSLVKFNAFRRVLDLAYRSQHINTIYYSYLITTNGTTYFLRYNLLHPAYRFADFHIQITLPCSLPEG